MAVISRNKDQLRQMMDGAGSVLMNFWAPWCSCTAEGYLAGGN